MCATRCVCALVQYALGSIYHYYFCLLGEILIIISEYLQKRTECVLTGVSSSSSLNSQQIHRKQNENKIVLFVRACAFSIRIGWLPYSAVYDWMMLLNGQINCHTICGPRRICLMSNAYASTHTHAIDQQLSNGGGALLLMRDITMFAIGLLIVPPFGTMSFHQST